MMCPLCNNKLNVHLYTYTYGPPDYDCGIRVTPDPPGTTSYSHYTKQFTENYRADNHYIETAIILPFQITDVYANTDNRKPHCIIEKYKMTKQKSGRPFFHFEEIMRLPYILEILKYKRMQARMKNIVLFS